MKDDVFLKEQLLLGVSLEPSPLGEGETHESIPLHTSGRGGALATARL